MKKIIRQTENLGDSVGKKSTVDFDTSRKNVEFVLDETEKNLKVIFEKYNAADDLIFVIEKLRKELFYVFTANNVIKDFQEQQILVDMLADFNSKSIIANSDENDPKIIELDAINTLQHFIQKVQTGLSSSRTICFSIRGRLLGRSESSRAAGSRCRQQYGKCGKRS